jgi:hypothetical protein
MASNKDSNNHKPKTEKDLLVELVIALESIDEHGKLAKLNETTISDNNGGRIRL